MATPGDQNDDHAEIGAVTLVSVSGVLGGGELTLLRMAEALSRQVPVRIVGGAEDPLLSRARAAGLATGALEIGAKLGRRTALPNLLRYPRARRALHDAVAQATTGGWCLLQYKWEEVLWGGELAPERVALWEHGPIPPALLRAPWLRERLRRAFESAAAVFAWSAPAARHIAELSGREAIRLEHGVDVEAAARAAGRRAAVRERIGLPERAPLLASVGRVTRDKGVVEAAEALGELPEAHLVVCGAGPACDDVRAAAARAGATDRVHMLGHIEEPLDVLAAADVALLLTRSAGEGRPMAAIEALAVGTPVLGPSASPAMRGLAAYDGVNLTDKVNPAGVAVAVQAVLARPRPPAVGHGWETPAGVFLAALRGTSAAR